MKKITIFILAILIIASTQAQKLKTIETKGYGEIEMGNMTYTYYEDDSFKEIRHGNFKIIEKYAPSTGGTFNSTFIGNYKNGLPDGIWTLTNIAVDFGADTWYETSTLKIQYSFKDGKPDGVWTHKFDGKRRKRLFSISGYSWGSYETLTSESATITFKNGKLVGNVNFDYLNYSGKINEHSQWDGEWKINKRGSRIICDNGICKGAVMVDVYNERTITKYDSEILQLQEQYRLLTDKDEIAEFLKKNELEVTIIYGANHYGFGEFNRKIWRYNKIIDFDTLPKIYLGYFLEIKPKKFFPLNLSKYESSYYTVERLLNEAKLNENQWSNSDILLFNQFIEKRLEEEKEQQEKREREAKEQEEKRKQEEQEKSEYLKLELEYKVLRSKFDALLIKDEQCENNFKPEILKKAINDYPYTQFLKSIYDNLENEYYGIKTNKLENADLQYSSKNKQLLQELIHRLNSFFKQNEEKVINGKQIIKDFRCNIKQFICLFYENHEFYVYSGDWVKFIASKRDLSILEPFIKPKFSKPYFEIIEYNLNNLPNVSFSEQCKILQKLICYSKYLNANTIEKTKEIEKELNKATTIQQKIAIFDKFCN